MIRIVLVRHAETEGMIKGLRLGENEKITKKGEKEAINLKKIIDLNNFDFIYTSPSVRSIQTMESFLGEKKFKNIIKSNLLKERKEASSFLGKKTSDLPWNILKENRNNGDWKYEDGESFNEIFERTGKILKLFGTYNDGINILVFSHGSIIRSIIIYIIFNGKISPGEYFRLTEILKIKSCGISEIIYSKEKFEKIYTWKIKDFMNSNNIIY
ncbi:phosphoglycerate mutase family protein [Candidatus Gracilibacteria bacterium]|nr:phosphoglycerate mutase family protein [Candidatus Gracilibacteria bacterium]RKW23044.1 MAG: phosphoglycerate mutase family protein [Candidatus Gracilibacteria bacterium]